MAIVVRFFHIRTGVATGGATVKVVGNTSNVGQVTVQVTRCSKKDVFCKKTGRAEAEKAPTQVLPLRFLPKELGRVADKVDKIQDEFAYVRDYSFALKYFLPKE
jgi:hypothetical protein